MSVHLKDLTPVVEQYTITVSIPMKMPFIIVKGQTIHEAEYGFIRKRDRVRDHSKKVELDRARAVLKYALDHKATLNKMHLASQKLYITLAFSNMDNLIDFRYTMGSAVTASTMQ